MLTVKKKKTIIDKFQIHKTDTGSPEVQVAILSEKIKKLTSHLKKNNKDNHSRRGLLQMVADRRALMKFLDKSDEKRSTSLSKKLGLKKSKTSH